MVLDKPVKLRPSKCETLHGGGHFEQLVQDTNYQQSVCVCLCVCVCVCERERERESEREKNMKIPENID